MLKPRKKITKKQLKEDSLVTFYFKAQEWLAVHGKTLMIAAAAVLLAIAGFSYYLYAQTQAEKTASVELARATRTLEAEDYQNAISQLSGIVDSYGRTTSGKIARLHLAQTFFQTKEYANAQKSYKKFISSFNGDDYFLAAAQGGMAACLEAEKKYGEAADAYIKAAESHSSVLDPAMLLNAARCYHEAGNQEKAKKALNRIIEEHPKATEKDDALLLLGLINP